MSDTQTITVRPGVVSTVRVDDGGELLFEDKPGWTIYEPGRMVTTRELPDNFPPVARAACELLRAFGAFTPRQRACANAALTALQESAP